MDAETPDGAAPSSGETGSRKETVALRCPSPEWRMNGKGHTWPDINVAGHLNLPDAVGKAGKDVFNGLHGRSI
ncbi:hypothetical protein [Mycoplana sp. MJR14]|uniref:hypothetical protein n=1 Tax=Mycoplana sp. MJR14 TaxID=3032583 RepID=UPI0023DA553C|nr:hypothetical protein [Mycoplana sp. MJR14]MDF1632387.1 hypothetical protein [Mycoplana sp. MJR14]